jgi:GntR family transcriptional regulator
VRNDGVKQLPVSDLVEFRKSRADAQTAHELGLPPRPEAQQVYRLKSVLTVAAVPVVVSDIVIPVAMFPGLTEARVRTGGVTLYAVYQSHYGVNIVRTTEQLRAIKADPATAKALRVRAGEPVLEVRRTAYTFNDVPVEVRRSRVQTDAYHYLIDQGSTR